MNDKITNNETILVPQQIELQKGYNTAIQLVDDVVLKNYISKLNELAVVPLNEADIVENVKKNVRFFKITEMVYEKDEYATYKFASVLNSLSTANCTVFVIMHSDGEKTEFYMGTRLSDLTEENRDAKSLKITLENALKGQFPGIKTQNFLYDDKDNENMLDVMKNINANNIAAVSCIANSKDENINSNQSFIQGLEKLALSMQGKQYTAMIMANGTPQKQLAELRKSYESIYTQLSPFASMQCAYSSNESFSLSDALTHGTSSSEAHSINQSESESISKSENQSVSKDNMASKIASGVSVVASAVGTLLAPATGGVSLIVGGAVSLGANALGSGFRKTKTSGTSESKSSSKTEGTSDTTTESVNDSTTQTETTQKGIGQSLTLNSINKSITGILDRIDLQLERIKEFESLGMWECAAYFMANEFSTAEIAASTYKALMGGENSGVEMSAINLWDQHDTSGKTKEISNYLLNFMHPVFEYKGTGFETLNVTPCSLVSGNELAIHMGLPRKSVCGFPVIEHSDFGKEVVSYDNEASKSTINLGKVFNMGSETASVVKLCKKSLTMHTFVSGSTGSGKSNTIYEMLRQFQYSGVSFMVIEPAKGEYKNVFGNQPDVAVLGTNPAYSQLLRINPFKFPKKTHILEHIDRLVEIFNVCWPMYAAMPAVLKDAVLQAYEVCGWDLVKSVNKYSDGLFPTFLDLQSELVNVINDSAYSQELKSNYMGSLLTRVKSLTNGLNGQIFSANETDNRELFDRNVIVDLSRVGSMETKSLIMGILIMRLSEHRAAYTEGMNLPLKHITVLEEAHNILKRTSTEQNSEGSNVTGKSVEMISNAIAEMRTYGEGFIIADQSPNAVDISAIRNTNTKIIMRLPDENDRRLAGKAAALNDEQIDEIAKLPKGVAVVYQNNWIEPVLCKINKYKRKEELYKYQQNDEISVDIKQYKTEILKMLLKERTNERLEPDIDFIKEKVSIIDISTKNKIGILNLVEEYDRNERLRIWDDDKFELLSDMVFDFLDKSWNIENLIISSKTLDDITNILIKEITAQTENLSKELQLSACHCVMKHFSKDNDEKLTIYAAWRKEIVDKGVF